jgi:preprotein translocase subunit SecG
MDDYADRSFLILLIIFEFIFIIVCIVNMAYFNKIGSSSSGTTATYTDQAMSLAIANGLFIVLLILITAFTIYALVVEIGRSKEIIKIEVQTEKTKASLETSVHDHVKVLAKSLKKTKTKLDVTKTTLDQTVQKLSIPAGDPNAPAFMDSNLDMTLNNRPMDNGFGPANNAFGMDNQPRNITERQLNTEYNRLPPANITERRLNNYGLRPPQKRVMYTNPPVRGEFVIPPDADDEL